MKKITAINNAIKNAISIVAAKASKALQEPDYNVAIAVELPPLVNTTKQTPMMTITLENGSKPRTDSDCENNYLDGKYGAIPYSR